MLKRGRNGSSWSCRLIRRLDQDGLPVVLEQLKQDVQELGDRYVPPLRAQLNEGMTDCLTIAAPGIPRLPNFPALDTLLQSGLRSVRGDCDAEKTPEASDVCPQKQSRNNRC